AGVTSGDRMIVDPYVAIVASANDKGFVAQGVAGTHAWSGRIDVDEASIAVSGGQKPVRRGDPGFGGFLRAHDFPVRPRRSGPEKKPNRAATRHARAYAYFGEFRSRKGREPAIWEGELWPGMRGRTKACINAPSFSD